MASSLLPGILAKKGDTVDQSDVDGDWTNQEDIKRMLNNISKKIQQALANEPFIKTFLTGGFLEMVDYGYLEKIKPE